MRKIKSRTGFSLVELSIVLVILGLLTGGILAGQSLIHASELRSVTSDAARYKSAFYSFRDKYFALPGDITNATAIWGTAAVCPGDSTTPSTTAATCNGNGDNNIVASTSSSERFRYWQQLANAGLIEGNYNGVGGPSGTNEAIVGTNCPKAKLSGGGFGVATGPLAGDATDNPTSNIQHHLVFGAQRTAVQPSAAVLKPEEAWNIDTKLDDGKPATGAVIAILWPGCTTMATYSDTTGAYKLTDSTVQCALRLGI